MAKKHKGTLMGNPIPKREPQEYSRNIIEWVPIKVPLRQYAFALSFAALLLSSDVPCSSLLWSFRIVPIYSTEEPMSITYDEILTVAYIAAFRHRFFVSLHVLRRGLLAPPRPKQMG